MTVIIGLVVLVIAVIVGVTGVFANGGSTHALTDNFAVFGYHVTGSTGLLFLYGIVVGGVGLAGLSTLLAGARRTARLGANARRELKASRRNPAMAGQGRNGCPGGQQPFGNPQQQPYGGQQQPDQPPRRGDVGQLLRPTPNGRRPPTDPPAQRSPLVTAPHLAKDKDNHDDRRTDDSPQSQGR
jgi:hypothetical protein